MGLGPGLRKSTSKQGKAVAWAEERNTLRYGTRWIGQEDEDPFAAHFTEDVFMIAPRDEPEGKDSSDEAVRQYSVYCVDEEGDVLMND